MCVVCIEMAKGKLTFTEARRALKEIALNPEQAAHVREVTESIQQAEQKAKNNPPSNPQKKTP